MDSQRIALETEEQGADILRSLRGQREQIQNARDTVSFWLFISAFYVLRSMVYFLRLSRYWLLTTLLVVGCSCNVRTTRLIELVGR